jgi:NurA-like 5'-3' nuclease
MDVTELSKKQLDELKFTYLYDVENNYSSVGKITNEVIFKYYSGIDFVKEDFACTS